MAGREKKRAVWKYGAGVCVLAVCAVFAWFFPEAYGKWSDRRLLNQVRLSTRDAIRFLDSNSLTAIERWQVMNEFNELEDTVYTIENDWLNYIVTEEFTEFSNACTETIGRYAQCGVFPIEWQEEDAKNLYLQWVLTRDLYINEYEIPLGIFRFYMNPEQGEESELFFSIVMDLETRVVYYAAVTGAGVYDGMARELGYGSYEEMCRSLQQHEEWPAESRLPDADAFAAAFGVDSAGNIEKTELLNQSGSLKFDTQEMLGYQVFVEKNGLYGIAVQLWSWVWMEINRYGYVDNSQGTIEQAFDPTFYEEAEREADVFYWLSLIEQGMI